MKRISDSHRASSVERPKACSRVSSSASHPGHSPSLTAASEDAAELGDDDEIKCTRPRYITEDLIKKLNKQDNLSFVHCLNLSTTHGNKYFRYIENLDRCDRVQVLNLSNNIIEKIEKLEKIHELRELHLSNNRIRKIEGLEHMANLQILNLANNRIEHVPLWLGKKLRSLQKLNLQKNKIFSLHELTKLKLLKSFTELMLAENPVSDLPHYRLFLIFHLRSLEFLDGQPISEQEREKAHQRFHTEELERLEQELEERAAELEQLQEEKAVALKELEHQEKLMQQSQEQQWRQKQREMELNTKSELPRLPVPLMDSFYKLKQKTAELTRACQKQYELEQELAFNKIDTKFDPLPFDSNHDLDGDVLGESPYIGKACHKRNTFTEDNIDTGDRYLTTEGLAHKDKLEEDESRHDLAREKQLQQLREEMKCTEKQILRASEELQQLEEAASQKQAHVKAQFTGKNQLLSIMSKKQLELECRLDDMLIRIANETQEIKDLEQQFTEGQIAANEVLKKDLEDIISGLHDYLHGVKDQARQAQSDCLRLQKENVTFQQLLWDKNQQLSQLQQVVQICGNTKEELLRHQEEVQALRRENRELKEAQGHVSAYEADVETELQEKDCKISQLKEELSQLNLLSQVEHSALQVELQKERQAKENVLVQLQLATERELENTDLLQQVNLLQATERHDEEAELLHLRQKLQEAQEQQYLMLQRLQETESERDCLALELGKQDKQVKAEKIQTQKQLQALELEIRELRRSFSITDQLAAEQLHAAKEQLFSLHSTVQRISQERSEDAKELEESKMQADQAMQDLTKAESEIHVLQKLLQDRFHLSDTDSLSVPDASVQKQELVRLSQVLKKQKAQTKRLREQLAQALEDNSKNLSELIKEIEALRENLLQQSNYLSSFMCPTNSSGHWCYIPPYLSHQSLGSQTTQDSGLGSHYEQLPNRHKHSNSQQHKETRPFSSSGYWVYSPHQNDHNYGQRESSYENCNGENDEDSVRHTHFTPPPGSISYTMPPVGTHLPPGMVIYAPPVSGLAVAPGAVICGPPPEGVRLFYDPPPSSLHIPLIHNGNLHCNVPDHMDMTHSSSMADHSVREEYSNKVAKEHELLKLEDQRSELQMKLNELQGAVSRLQRCKRLLESSVNNDEEEILMDEVEFLEKTCNKRRTELQELELLLSEAEKDMKAARAKTNDTMQHYSEAKRKLTETEFELEEIKQHTQDSTSQLVHAIQELQDLHEEVKNLQTYKQEQKNTLKQVEKAIASQDAESNEVNRNLKRVTNKETQNKEAIFFMGCRNSEDILYTHRQELEHLKVQLASDRVLGVGVWMLLQKEQLCLLKRKLEQWREEEGIVKANVENHRQSLVEVLRQGEEDVHSLQQQIKELRVNVQSLVAQKGKLDSQLSERRGRLAQCKKEQKKVQEKMLNQRTVISQHKSELKHVLDMIQLESVELEKVKVQHNQKLKQLEKNQEALLQLRLELQEVEKEVQEQQVERERLRRLQEQEILTLKEQTNAAAIERCSLLEQCTSLEACRSNAQRCQESAEEGIRKAEEELLKLQTELAKLKQDCRHAQSIRKEVTRDAVTTQKQLEEKSRDLNKLEEDIAHSSLQLQKIRKEVEDAQQEQDDFIKQQEHQKAVMQDKIQRRQQRIDKLEQQLKEIEASVEKKEIQFERQEERLMIQQQQSLDLEEQKRGQQQKLKTQLQVLEEALLKRVRKMEQVTIIVEELEEQRRFLLADQQQCALLQDRKAQLERDLAESEARLRASKKEQREVKEKLGTCHSDICLLQEALATEKEHAEALISRSLTDRDKLEQAELWSCGEGDNHIQSHEDIKDTVCSLRAEVQAELDRGLKELELQPMTTSDMDIDGNHTSAALDMGKTAYSNRDKQWRGKVLRDKLRQHEENLKAQLRKCMFSQQEALSLRRQQMEGSIQGLCRRVDKLDQLLTQSGQDFPIPQ